MLPFESSVYLLKYKRDMFPRRKIIKKYAPGSSFGHDLGPGLIFNEFIGDFG